MANEHVLQRLRGIQGELIAARAASSSMSAASRGREREAFVSRFLENVLPTPFRFGSGDVTDSDGRRSGQLDVVVEYGVHRHRVVEARRIAREAAPEVTAAVEAGRLTLHAAAAPADGGWSRGPALRCWRTSESAPF